MEKSRKKYSLIVSDLFSVAGGLYVMEALYKYLKKSASLFYISQS